MSRSRRWLPLALAALLLPACVSVPKRTPLPGELQEAAGIPGIPDARQWGDATSGDRSWFELPDAEVREMHPDLYGKPHTYLAISGGGSNGAFGAGLLCGWTEAGDRPDFSVVTGVSTGALIAPFAFVGPEYDDTLRQVYTTLSTKDLLKRRSIFNRFTSDAATSSEPMDDLLLRYIDERLMRRIAEEHREGRRIHVGTTHLDAGRPVVWDLGEIAASGAPGALNLIRQVLKASASVPGVFPPVLIDVEAEGATYDEMHVDGGATAQVFLYPPQTNWEEILDKLRVPGIPRVYVIRNSVLEPKWRTTKNKFFPISGRTIGSLIRTQGIGDLYRIYMTTFRDGLDFNLATIPEDFDVVSKEQFDPDYMSALFDVGYEAALAGYPWAKTPPMFEEEDEKTPSP